jgi:predicted nucleic acid-binding protein
MTKLLIDSDVILDFFLDRKPFSYDATNIIALGNSKAIGCYTTPLIISNVYYFLNKAVRHEKAIELIKSLLSIVDIVTIDKKIVFQAMNSSFTDFEDAMQNYAAEANKKITTIVTRNVKDYKNSSLIVMTPADFLLAENK